MKPVEFGRGGCTRTLQYMDSYLANELLVETNHEVLRHVENCPSCAAELDARTRVRARLREAVRAEITPPDLQARVRQQIQARGSRSFFAAEWTRWAAAAAACFVAHQCGFNGRRYVHLTLQNGQNLLSLVIARKNPGRVACPVLTAAQRPGGIPVYQSAAHHYEVAGFETPEYMAFVVLSDLGAGRNLQIAAGLAPVVHEYLRKAA